MYLSTPKINCIDINQVDCEENPSNCVNDNISKVLEVYDEETCLETMRGEKVNLFGFDVNKLLFYHRVL